MAKTKSGRQKYHKEPVNYSDTVQRYGKMPGDVTSCANYRKLSYPGCKLIQDANTLFTGQNNGNICLAHSLMEPLGWQSKDALLRARRELLYYGFIVMTKCGTNRKPDLYALAWINIHSCGGKHAAGRTTEPTAEYLLEKPLYAPPKRKRPTIQPETARLLANGEAAEWTIPKEARQ